MPSIDVMGPPGQALEDQVEEPPAPPPPVIGIIYPPPEVRNIVDKTASFVARNGPEFEARIRQNELGNPKFNFLNSGDPYHAYYQHKVKEIREGKGPDPSAPAPAPPGITRGGLAPATAARQQELLKAAAPAEPPPPRDPPPDFEFIADPPSISALELDIVKLTAQFVARNGRQFLTDLMKKEERNHQFDFLRPQHSLFQYFTRLLEQYTKVLLPPKELVSKLASEIRNGVLEQARSRAAWHSHQARRKAADEARIEKERLAYASIDWHDFVVVETVDYPAGEPGEFPPPTTPPAAPAPPPPAPAAVLLQPLPPLMVLPPMAPRPPLIPTPVGVGGVVGGVPPSFGFPTPGPPPVDDDDAPAAKRTRTEDALEPETSWLARHPGVVPLQVALPSLPDRSEWRLDGRIVPMSIALGAPVAELKSMLQRATNMPTAKQKLHYEGLFFKDTNTLAYYNVPPGAVIHLQVKERGGRKK